MIWICILTATSLSLVSAGVSELLGPWGEEVAVGLAREGEQTLLRDLVGFNGDMAEDTG